MITQEAFDAIPINELRKLCEAHPEIAHINIIDWNDVTDMHEQEEDYDPAN